MSCIGIDIGYQSSIVSAPKGGGIDVLNNEYSLRQTASLVAFTDKMRIVGETAKLKQVTHFRDTVNGLKKLVGKKFSDPEVQRELSRNFFEACEMPDGQVGVYVNCFGERKPFAAVQLLGMLIYKLRTVGEQDLKVPKITDCVVSVPSYFTNSQRQAYLDACQIAGMNCLRLLNDTTAVALAYGIYKQDLPDPEKGEKPRRVVFCNLGHSSFQVWCAEFVKGKLTTLSSEFDADLGGRDVDLLLFNHFAEVFKKTSKLDIKTNKRASIRLEQECEKLKKSLSQNSGVTPINIECLMEERDFNSNISRADFEAMIQPVLQRIEAVCRRLITRLEAHGVTLQEINEVEIVGGASRIPCVRALFTSVFGQELRTTLNFDEAVSRGCALQAAISSPTFRVREFKIEDRTMYGIDLKWDAPEPGSLAAYGPQSAPTLKAISFNRSEPFSITASYTNPALVPGNEDLIGSFKIDGVHPSHDGQPQKVKVRVHVNESGCFVVDGAVLSDKLPEEAKPAEPTETPTAPTPSEGEAEKKEEGASKEEEAKPKKTTRSVVLTVVSNIVGKMSPDQLRGAVETELDLQAQDRMEVERSNAKNSLEEYLYEMRDKLIDQFAEYISDSDKDAFQAKLMEVEDWLNSGDADDLSKQVYADKLTDLQKVGKVCARRYHESEIRPALEEQLAKSIVHYRKFLDEHAAGDEKYSHIAATDVAIVKAEVDKAESWLFEKRAAQQALKKFQDPALLSSDLTMKRDILEKLCSPILSKPKPKPKEQPPPVNTEKKDEAAPQAEPEAKPMETN